MAQRKIARHRRAGACGRPIGLVNAGADRLPFASGSFAPAASTLIFHHLPTDTKRAALSEIHRVLAPDGRFLLADFGPADSPAQRLFVWFVCALRVPETATLADNVAGRLPAFLREAGFAVEEVAPPRRGVRFLRATRAASVAAFSPLPHPA